MKPTLRTGLSIFAASALLLPLHAFAETGGADAVVGIVDGIGNLFVYSWPIVAVVMLVVMGFRMIVSSDGSEADKAKKTIGAVVVGMAMIMLAGPLRIILYQTGANFIAVPAAEEIGLEAVGIAQWVAAMAAMVGILMIVLSVLRALTSFGDENAYSNVRTTLAHVIGGIAVIAVSGALKVAIFNNDPNPLLHFIMLKVIIVLAFLTLIVVIILIYAGILMVVNLGNDDALTKGRGLILRTLGGLAVIGISYALARFVIFLL